MLPDATRFYIDGEWVTPRSQLRAEVIDPSTEAVLGEVALADAADVDRAVAAARRAFPDFSASSIAERLRLLQRIDQILVARNDDIASAISAEMGAPDKLARRAQAPSGTQHFAEIIRVLDKFSFSDRYGTTLVRREPIGVSVLISPWNWPINQIATKVAPAIAAGCTMVLKPSELAPYSALILAEILDEAGVPSGVFNLVNGTGAGIGECLTSHRDVDMISFTGSTRAGIAISEAAATTVKRVALELGGKSAGILLPDADLHSAVPAIVDAAMGNTGQSCNALTRLMVPADLHDAVSKQIAEKVAAIRVGTPGSGAKLGPLANRAHFDKVRRLIEAGIDEGASLLAGGADRPQGFSKGFFVRPTVFADVSPDMRVAREEIFGPVLSILPVQSVAEAIRFANDSEYGLSGYVWSADHERAVDIASRLRTGMVHINGAPLDSSAPFGGYKMSGNGREWGAFGLDEFLELKSVYGGVPSGF